MRHLHSKAHRYSITHFLYLCRSGLRSALRPLAYFKQIGKKSPLTSQSYIILAFCCYLLVGPVPQSSDIVAATAAWGFLAIVGIISSITILHGLRAKRNLLNLRLFTPRDSSAVDELVQCALSIPAISLLPGVFLECSVELVRPLNTTPQVRLHGSWRKERKIALSMSFPHRGNWDTRGIRCTVGDISGFVRVSWTVPQQTSIVVAPSVPSDSQLPLISSTQRPGDLVPDAIHRQGDPFDIKPYHPADGINKIVWKAFAKSGQLLSRHAEPSMAPEGFVTICVLARPEDDELCGLALAYVSALQELKLDILLSCEGHNGRSLGTDFESSKTLLIDSVWDAANSTTPSRVQDLQALIDTCARGDSKVAVRKMALFCSGARVTSQFEASQMLELATWLEEQNIEPVFFLTKAQALARRDKPSFRERAQGLLLEESYSNNANPSTFTYQGFLTTCLARQWEVFI